MDNEVISSVPESHRGIIQEAAFCSGSGLVWYKIDINLSTDVALLYIV